MHCSKLLQKRVCVYMFHSIGDARHDLNISIETFDFFLRNINKQAVIRLEDWENHSGYVCLTFDDVPDSFYYNALPLLKKYKIPFTIFVSCSLLDTKGFITTEMLKEIAECELCTVGSHGWKHDFYSVFTVEETLNDLSSSKKRLEEIIHKDVELFAFPYGSIYACGFRKTRFVKKCYKYGFGTIATPITSPLLLPIFYLPRMAVTESNIKSIIKNE